MALKDNWTDLVDNESYIQVEDINKIASELISTQQAVEEFDNQIEVVQTTGDSETAVMSQKATTEAIEAVEDMVSTEYTDFTTIAGVFINNQGVERSNQWWNCTDYIEVSKVNYFFAKFGDAAVAAFYDVNKNYINGAFISGDNTAKWHKAIAPIDAVYLRISYQNDTPICKFVSFPDQIGQVRQDLQDMKLTTVKEFTDFTMTTGIYVGKDGGEKSSQYHKASNYIRVSDANNIKTRMGGNATIAFYNSNYEFISAIVSTESESSPIWYSFTAPDNAVYLRFSCYGVNNTVKAKFISKVDEVQKALKAASDLKTEVENLGGFDSVAFDAIRYNRFRTYETFGVIGDSLASGSVYYNTENGEAITPAGVSVYSKSWVQYLARILGNTGINFTRGGLSTRTWLTSAEGLPKAQEANNICECYIIGLGVNDDTLMKNGAMTMGTIADINTTDKTLCADTYYGNYGRIILELKDIQPHADIFLFTIPPRTDIQNRDAMNTAINDMAILFDNIHIIDLSADDFFNSAEFKATWYYGHGSAYNYQLCANHIAEKLSEYMKNHAAEFYNIQFIGTEHKYER